MNLCNAEKSEWTNIETHGHKLIFILNKYLIAKKETNPETHNK